MAGGARADAGSVEAPEVRVDLGGVCAFLDSRKLSTVDFEGTVSASDDTRQAPESVKQ